MPNFNGLWTSRQQMQARGGNTWPSVPGAPTSPVATAGNTSASVAFTAPADTGFPANSIIGYRVTSSPGGFTGTGATSPVTVSGLTNGTAYTFTVAALNVNGYGPESVVSNSVTPLVPNYVEEVFSTYLYAGNGATQTITNGIDLSTEGGLVWIKGRDIATNNLLFDTNRGVNKYLVSDGTNAEGNPGSTLSAFNADGFTVQNLSNFINETGFNYASWTFRQQPKFFDVVTYTGTGSARTVAHNLGSIPGCIIVKRLNAAANWQVYHRANTANPETDYLVLNTTAATADSDTRWNDTLPTDAVFSLGTEATVNASGGTYVAYIYAHDAGGFGLAGTDNVISCGSFTEGAGNVAVDLGYEPQWILVKPTTGSQKWNIYDNMRGLTTDSVNILEANTSSAEQFVSGGYYVSPTATGFIAKPNTYGSGVSCIYIAIRRGPMKVPTDATKVFAPVAVNNSSGTFNTIGFPFDLAISKNRSSAAAFALDRLRGINSTNSTANLFPLIRTTSGSAEDTSSIVSIGVTNTGFKTSDNYAGLSTIYWNFQRSPTFMDVVCYVGTGVARTVSHNLQAVPELMIVRRRTPSGGDWWVYSQTLGNTTALFLNTDYVPGATPTAWNNTTPTSSVFTVGTYEEVNGSGSNMVAYLFATCPGVSKVGSYTGTGATQTIACGFAAGARFVLIKRTGSTSDWYIWDSARGMVAGTDPSLLINSTAAEVNANSIYTVTSGFQIVSTAAGINASGGSYIFLAIA